MQTLLDSFVLLMVATLFNFLSIFFLNAGGLLGGLIGRGQHSKSAQFSFAIFVSTVGQSYIYLCYTAFIAGWAHSRISGGHSSKYIIWIISFFANIIPIIINRRTAIREAIEVGYINPQVLALTYTVIIAFFAFLAFAMFPDIMKPLWSWIPFVS